MTNIHPTAFVSPQAVLKENVTVGPFTCIHAGVTIGENTVIEGWCDIGHAYKDEQSLTIGPNSTIRSHSIFYKGSSFGERLTTGHHVTVLAKTEAGRNLQIGSYGDIQGHCKIGDFTSFQSNVFVAPGSTIGSFCWLFPNTTLTNDPHPPSNTTLGVVIEDFAVVASHSIIMPGIRIGRASLVGANSLVNRDVAPETFVVGSPAKEKGPTSLIKLRENTHLAAYPWTTHFRSKYPEDITQNWPTAEALSN